MRIDELHVFLEICRQRSIRKAAESLGVSQPSLTKKMQKLEHAFGAPLLNRLPRGVEPTAYGSVLEQHARYAVGELDHAHDIIHGMRSGRVGTVRIGVSIAAILTLLPRVIERVQSHKWDADIRIIENTVENLSQELIAGNLDMVVAPIPRVGPDRDLNSRHLLDDELVVVGRDGHPASGQSPLVLAQLVGYPWAVLGANPYKASQLVPLLLRDSLPMPKWILETNSIGFLVSFLHRSNCLVLLSNCLATHFAGAGIRALDVTDAVVPWPIMLTLRKKSIVTPLMRAVIEALDDEVQRRRRL